MNWGTRDMSGPSSEIPNIGFANSLGNCFTTLLAAREQFRAACANLTAFLGRRLYQDFGMKELIARFYESIQSGGAPPIPYREILSVARIMDEIFAQIYDRRLRTEDRRRRTDD